MIISISGRKSSGKTILANEVVKRGFKKISFADKLKKVTAELVGCCIEDLCDPQLKEEKFDKPIFWLDIQSKLESILGKKINKEIENKLLYNRRDALQFLGTEVLREVDPEFHINSLKEQIEPNKDYVLDDTRFLNELDILNSLNATCVFIIRPYYLKYSNHKSETELNRKNFKNVIINNKSQESLLKHFNHFLDNKIDLKNNVTSRMGGNLSEFFLTETPTSCYIAGMIYASSKMVFENNTMLLALDKKLEFSQSHPIDLISICNEIKMIDHQIYLDDFKRWDIIQDDKCMYSYPKILKDKKDLQAHWFSGIKQGLISKK
jgi:hypothetical protein